MWRVADLIAIAAPAAQLRNGMPLAGSEERPCFDCGTVVVLSPSSIKREPRWVLCHGCGASLINARPDLLLQPTPEALAEFIELQRRARG
jgi:hypothetical protein